jgi:hypothetical protein
MLRLASNSAPVAPLDELNVPRYSSGYILPLDELESPTLKQIAEYWSRLKGLRKFPSRAELEPRNFKNLLRHMSNSPRP